MSPPRSTRKTSAPPAARAWRVGASPRHGRGVFASARIAEGKRIVEYTGELISLEESERRYPSARDAPEDPEHTYLLMLDDERVIDANVGGNDSRFINHCCTPNCEPMVFGDRMWIVAVRDIAPGEELGYDYAIELDERHTSRRKKRFSCTCGAAACRGSILRPKRQPMDPLVRRALRRFGPGAPRHHNET